MLEHSSAHHTSVAEGNKGPPFASIVTTRRRVQGSPLCFNCYDPPEGTRVPPLLQLLRSAATVKLLRSAATVKLLRSSATVKLLRSAATVKLLRSAATVKLLRSAATVKLLRSSATVKLLRSAATVKLLRSSATVKLLRSAGGYKGPPFASIVTTRRRVQGSPLCFNCYDPQPPTTSPRLSRPSANLCDDLVHCPWLPSLCAARTSAAQRGACAGGDLRIEKLQAREDVSVVTIRCG